jgi:hypothetical protein
MGDTKVDDLKILEFFQVGLAANITALWFMHGYFGCAPPRAETQAKPQN